MKTKLEIGKEYWLGEAKEYKGIYKGNFGNAHYFDVVGIHEFTQDANGFVEFPLRGVFEIEQWKFITPIAMKCTEEQFNGIKDRLVEMGYALSCSKYGEGWLCTNYNAVKDSFSMSSCTVNQPTVFDYFNPDLFLSLAAMTDKEGGIKGEWWKCTDKADFSEGLLFIKTESDFSEMLRCKDDQIVGTGFNAGDVSKFRKATEQEIIEYFEKKEFMLPENWCVEITDKNVDLLWSWTGFKFQKKSYINYVTYRKTHSKEIPEDCIEITFDQFKKYVLKETEQSCQIIPTPPTKQATLFDDRVEITDWKPVFEEKAWQIFIPNYEFIAQQIVFKNTPYQKDLLERGFIKRTESEAKQLVEKLKQVML